MYFIEVVYFSEKVADPCSVEPLTDVCNTIYFCGVVPKGRFGQECRCLTRERLETEFLVCSETVISLNGASSKNEHGRDIIGHTGSNWYIACKTRISRE